MTLDVRLVSADDAGAVLALFDRAGVACHCRYWHFEGTKNDWLARCAFDAQENARELSEALVAGRHADGVAVIARNGDDVVGWAKLFPKANARKLLRQGPYNAYSATHTPDTWCLGCVLVDPSARRGGVARALALGLEAAGRSLGASAIEAFPRVGHGPVSDEELWMGIGDHLEAAGFQGVAGEAPYPVYRLALT
jgi:hypothetical protein